MELMIVSIAIILGGTLVSDDILNNRLRIGEKLAEGFSRSSAKPALSVDEQLESNATEVLTK